MLELEWGYQKYFIQIKLLNAVFSISDFWKMQFSKREMWNSSNSQNDEEIEIQAIKHNAKESFPMLTYI